TIAPAHIPALDQEHRIRVHRRPNCKRSDTVFQKIAESSRHQFLVDCITNTGWRKLLREEWHSRPPDVFFAEHSRRSKSEECIGAWTNRAKIRRDEVTH